MHITDLKTKRLSMPIGISIDDIQFSWVLNSEKENVRQKNYQIILYDNDLPVWDSTVIESDQSNWVCYTGPVLKENRTYTWTVTVEDSNGDSANNSSSFHTGIVAEHFCAKWIEPDLPPIEPEPKTNMLQTLLQLAKVKEPDEKLTPSSFFRKEFVVREDVVNAYLYITAHGVYHVELNGRSVDDRCFAPEYTSYHNRLLYQVYDVKELLISGTNAIGVIVADGWWGGRINYVGKSCTYGNMHALFMQLELEYADGSHESVCSDSSFRCKTGPYRYSDLFIGEKYDANMELTDWSKPAYNVSDWKEVYEKDYSLSNLKPQEFPPVKCCKKIPAQAVLHTPNGETVIDFGQNLAGHVTMTVDAPKGTVILMQHMEELDKDGNFFINIQGDNKQQTDTYICRGTGRETYTPMFTFHGFRYVKLTGYPGEPDLENFTANVLSSDNEDTGSFFCSNDKLNKLQSNIYWSQISNFISVPTDCPQRERSGYTGDMEVYIDTAVFNQNNQAFLESWLRTAMEEQLENGVIQAFAPTYPMGTSDQGIAGWSDAIVIVPYKMFLAYGDKRILENCYSAMKKWMQHAAKRAHNKNSITVKVNPRFWFDKKYRKANRYLWNDGFHFGDWLIPSKTMAGPMGMLSSVLFGREAFVSGYYANSVAIMEKVARILGKEKDAERFGTELRHIKSAFTYVNIDKYGHPKPNYQGVNAMTLKFDLVPDHMKAEIADNLEKLIHENGDRLDTGFLSVDLLMDALWENAKKDVCYKLLYQEECPSWLYEVNQGATTMWEKWNNIMPDGNKQQVSYNHYAFGCVGKFMYRHILGIQNMGVGYDKIRIRPEPDALLTYAKGHYKSIYGKIETEWEKKDGRFNLKVTIPCNTEAVIELPDGETFQRGSGKYEFWCEY